MPSLGLHLSGLLTMARIFDTMSLDWRKSDTPRISSLSWIVFCVRWSRISVTMGIFASDSSSSPPPPPPPPALA